MPSWRAGLVAHLSRRFPDAQELLYAVRAQFGPDFAAALTIPSSAQKLAHEVLDHCERVGFVSELFDFVREHDRSSDPQLDEIERDCIAAGGDARLDEVIDAYLADARRIARRPRLEALVRSLVDAPAPDLEQVFVAPRVRPFASPLESARRGATTGSGATMRGATSQPTDPGPETPLLGLWPEQAAWILLLGDAGAGKSTLACWLTVRPPDNGGHVPVRIELQRYAAWHARPDRPAAAGFFAYLHAIHRDDGVALSGRQLHALALAGRVLWLIDGLDELTDPVARLDCARRIANLRRHGGRAVITSRPLGVRREIELLREAGVTVCTLQPFAAPDLAELGRRWQAAGLIEADALRRCEQQLANSPGLRELAKSPLISTFLLVLARDGDLPPQRCRLLARICELVVRKWAEQRQPAGYTLDAATRTAFLRDLAWEMATGLDQGLANLVERGPLLDFAARAFERRSTMTRDEAERRAEVVIAELAAHVSILSPFGRHGFGFAHRSFLEFFAADALVHRGDGEVVACFAARWADTTWSEILAIAAGLLADRAPQLAARALRGVFAQPATFDAARLLAASEFTARCLTEVEALASPAFGPLCDELTALWIAAGPLSQIDFRPLARTLRTIGPRWPARAALLAWLRSTHGRARAGAIHEYGTGFSGGNVHNLANVRLALAVAAPTERHGLLELLAGQPSHLQPLADAWEALGPWSEAERRSLVSTLGSAGWDWDMRVAAWLGDLRGTRVEHELIVSLLCAGERSWNVPHHAILLLTSSTRRRWAMRTLDRIAAAKQDFLPHDFTVRLIAALEHLETEGRSELCRELALASTPEIGAAACLVLAEGGVDEAAARLAGMLRATDPRIHLAANWALAYGRFTQAHARVLEHLDGDLRPLTLVYAVSACANIIHERGRSELAQALWCHLADSGGWSPSMRWLAVGSLLRRPAWRELGMARLRNLATEPPPNSPNMDYALRALAEQEDGRDALASLLRDDPDPIRRRFVAQVLLEREPDHAEARAELCAQVAGSSDRDTQHKLAHLMRRLGLPRADWEEAARKLVTYVEDPIARCASATLLGDREAMQALVDTAPDWPDGLSAYAQSLLDCENLRRRIAGWAASADSTLAGR